MKVPVLIRPAKSEDVNFIKNSWSQSFRKSMQQMESSLYNDYHDRHMVGLMERCHCFVACNPDDHYQIYGWVLFEAVKGIGILHYIYVKHPFRRYGIGTKLYNEMEFNRKLPCLATHATKCLDYITGPWKLVYNPYLLVGDL